MKRELSFYLHAADFSHHTFFSLPELASIVLAALNGDVTCCCNLNCGSSSCHQMGRREVLIPELSSVLMFMQSTAQSDTRSLLKRKEGERGESPLCGFAAVS